jgi:dihydroorotate dehydrogenase (fumarate)
MDLRTTYLGLELNNPLVPSSSPLTRHLMTLRELEDAGAAAVVLPSLFEEEINRESHTLDRYLTEGTESFAEALSYFPEAPAYRNVGPDAYLEHVYRTKRALDIPVIASLNGISPGGWTHYAAEIEQAGADALELNIYYIVTNTHLIGQEVEQIYLNVLREVKETISIPVAMKLIPYFSSIPNMAYQLAEEGADGLVLFNRFYQPDLDLDNLEVVPNLVLSSSAELRLPLRWIAILYGRVAADLALTTGVHTATDVLKGVAAGAKVTMLASELLQSGIDRLSTILAEITDWLEFNEYQSLAQLQGSLSQINVGAPAAFERANYMRVVGSYDIPDLPMTSSIP